MAWKDRTGGRISQEHVEFSSDSQLNHFEFGKPPNMKFLGKLAFQVLKFAKDLWQILRSTRRFLVLYLMFLIFSFCCQALRCLLPKKSKPRPVLTIPNHVHLAFRRSNSRLAEFLHRYSRNATKEHVFSIATTMWHSTISLLSHFSYSTILTGIEQVCAFGWISSD